MENYVEKEDENMSQQIIKMFHFYTYLVGFTLVIAPKIQTTVYHR